ICNKAMPGGVCCSNCCQRTTERCLHLPAIVPASLILRRFAVSLAVSAYSAAGKYCGVQVEKQFKIKLVIRRAPALAALGWLKHSWHIFVQAPLVWVLMFVTLAAMALLSQLHPLLAIAAIMLNPFLTAGVYKAIVA